MISICHVQPEGAQVLGSALQPSSATIWPGGGGGVGVGGMSCTVWLDVLMSQPC